MPSPLLCARLYAVVAAVALATGCTSSTTSSSTASSDASSRAGTNGGTIKIGIDLPVSGADASTGIPTQQGAQLAVDEANLHAPTGYSFATDARDDAVQGVHDPAQGGQNVRTFVSDASVLAIIGPFNSNVAKVEIPITNEAGLAQVAPSTTSTTLTQGDDAAKLRTSHPDVNAFFRVCTTDDRQGAADAQFAKTLGLHKVFIIDDNETYGKGLADVFEAQATKNGLTVLGHEHTTRNQQDFKALLTKAQSSGPDVVFFGGTTSNGGGLVRKQMFDVGLGKVAFLGGDGISDREFEKVAGSAADGSYFSNAAPEASKLPSATTFIAAYKKKYGADVGAYSANAYAAAQIEIAAIEKAIAAAKAVPTRADVLKNVAATTGIQTPIGKIGFDKNGDTTVPILSLYKIQGGKAVFVNQLALKS